MILSTEKSCNIHNDCPTPEMLIQFHRNHLTCQEDRLIRSHIASCDSCIKDSLLVANIIKKEKSLVREVKRKAISKRWIELPVMRYMAGGLIVVSLGLLVINNIRKRTVVNDRETRAITTAVIDPVRAVSSSHSVIFEWQNVRSAEHYIIELYGDSLELLWKSNKIHNLAVSLPEDYAQRLIIGKRYMWVVSAYLPDGKTVKSKLSEFIFQ